jgi:hypothetical protein
MIRPAGGQPPAGLSAYLVVSVTIDYIVVFFFNIVPLISEFTFINV